MVCSPSEEDVTMVPRTFYEVTYKGRSLGFFMKGLDAVRHVGSLPARSRQQLKEALDYKILKHAPEREAQQIWP
jgi:hypothetical protein